MTGGPTVERTYGQDRWIKVMDRRMINGWGNAWMRSSVQAIRRAAAGARAKAVASDGLTDGWGSDTNRSINIKPGYVYRYVYMKAT